MSTRLKPKGHTIKSLRDQVERLLVVQESSNAALKDAVVQLRLLRRKTDNQSTEIEELKSNENGQPTTRNESGQAPPGTALRESLGALVCVGSSNHTPLSFQPSPSHHIEAEHARAIVRVAHAATRLFLPQEQGGEGGGVHLVVDILLESTPRFVHANKHILLAALLNQPKQDRVRDALLARVMILIVQRHTQPARHDFPALVALFRLVCLSNGQKQRLRVMALDLLSCWQSTDVHILHELSQSPKESLGGDGVLADVVHAVAKSVVHRCANLLIASGEAMPFLLPHNVAGCTGDLVGVMGRANVGMKIAKALEYEVNGAPDGLPEFATGVVTYLASPHGARAVPVFEMTMAVRLMIEHLSWTWTKACVVGQLLPTLAVDTATFGLKLYNVALVVYRALVIRTPVNPVAKPVLLSRPFRPWSVAESKALLQDIVNWFVDVQ